MIEQAHLIERAKALEHFQFLLQQPFTWVLIVTGLDGIGKSQFLEQIKTHYTQDITLSLTIDFADDQYQEPLNVMETIAEYTADYCDPDTVRQFRQKLTEVRHDIQKFLLNKNKFVMKIEASDGSTVSGNALRMQAEVENALREVKKHARELVRESLCKQLVTFSERISSPSSSKKLYLLLCFDECQKLDQDNFKWVEALSKTIRERLRVSQASVACLVVGASRTKLFPEIIKRDEYHILPLEALSPSDTKHYLQARGIVPEPELCKVFYDLTKGHPLCLALAAEIYQEMQQESLPFSATVFIERFYQRAWNELIQARVTNDLKKSYADVIYYGTFAEYFTDNILRRVLKIPMGTDEFKYHELTRLPSIVPAPNHHTYHAIDSLIRRIIIEYEKKHHPEECKYAKQYRKEFERLCKQSDSGSILSWSDKFNLYVAKKRNKGHYL